MSRLCQPGEETKKNKQKKTKHLNKKNSNLLDSLYHDGSVFVVGVFLFFGCICLLVFFVFFSQGVFPKCLLYFFGGFALVFSFFCLEEHDIRGFKVDLGGYYIYIYKYIYIYIYIIQI